MATYNNNMGTTGHPAHRKMPYMVTTVIDFSATTNATNDVFEAINIPAGTVILNAGIYVVTADSAGNSGTVALGDGSVTYVAATAPTSAGAYIASGDAVGEMFVCFAAANTLDVTVATGAINAKIQVWALLADSLDPDGDQVVTFTAA